MTKQEVLDIVISDGPITTAAILSNFSFPDPNAELQGLDELTSFLTELSNDDDIVKIHSDSGQVCQWEAT